MRFIARQGLPLKGHDYKIESGKLFQLLKLRGEDVSRIESWIKEESMQISIHHDSKRFYDCAIPLICNY